MYTGSLKTELQSSNKDPMYGLVCPHIQKGSEEQCNQLPKVSNRAFEAATLIIPIKVEASIVDHIH